MGYHKFWTNPAYHCWAGNKGLHKTMAWTFLFATEGELHVTIMPETMEQFLPAEWVNLFPADITENDTPFLADLKYIDVVLRPGTALFMPPHWFMSWSKADSRQKAETKAETKAGPKAEPNDDTYQGPVMACTISYHTPISYLAFHMSPFVQH
jgi:hypothetical protein